MSSLSIDPRNAPSESESKPKRPTAAIVIVVILVLIAAAALYVFGKKGDAASTSQQTAPTAQTGGRT